MASLVASQAAVTAAIAALTARAPRAKNPVARPEPFKGVRADARRFLHYFSAWARNEGAPMNVLDAQGRIVDGNHELWITTAISFLQGEAATWASQYLQAIEANTRDNRNPYPFGKLWTGFLDAYHLRWLPTDDTEEAMAELDAIVQGKKSVAEYAGRFQEVSPRTNLNDAGLISRFKKGMTNKSKQWLALASLHDKEGEKPTTIGDLIKRAQTTDAVMRNLDVDTKQSAQPAADPFAMEVDATRASTSRNTRARPAQGGNGRTRDDFIEAMRGRCFGCGSESHNFRDGNHKATKCTHCERLGHLQSVCQDRFRGLAKGLGRGRAPRQRVAASGAPFSLFPDEDLPAAAQVAATATITAAAPASDVAALVAAMQAQTQTLAALTGRGDF
jgi:hypothetical protein